MNNIFLMGKAGSGKDTVADILHKEYGVKPIAFADPIRAEYRRFFPNGNPRTDRSKMIEIGQTYKQLYGNDIWVRQTLKDVGSQIDLGNPVVITDGRHQVEYDFFVGFEKYIPIFVTCPDEIRYARLLSRDGTLQEEALKKECQELWNADTYTIDNSDTLENLKTRIICLMELVGR